MKLDSLLKEYRDPLSNAPAIDFEALIQRESARKSRRKAFAWIGLAAAACLAAILFLPVNCPQLSPPCLRPSAACPNAERGGRNS